MNDAQYVLALASYPVEAHTNNHIMVSVIEASYAEKEYVHFQRFTIIIPEIPTSG
ncbi:MAG: hypothetical protein ABR986_07010 [Methanomassiliicoccales archaeon]|jgi:hypothetical protein